jgi:hypothetical protein
MEAVNNSHIAIGTLFEAVRMKAGLDTVSQSHLNDCDLCRGRQSWMATATSLGTHELQYEPPQDVLARVVQLSRRPGLLKQLQNFIVASLSFDSFSNLAPAGVRQTETTSRQVTYEAGDVEIAIWVQPSPTRTVTLTGQVLFKDGKPIEDTSAQIEVVVEGDHIASSSLSPWGEFVFPDLPQAAYGLQVSLGDRIFRIPSLPE